MTSDRAVPDATLLRRMPATTARVARALTVLVVVGFGLTVTLATSTADARAGVLVVTGAAVAVVARLTSRRAGRPAPSAAVGVRAALATVVTLAAGASLVADLGLAPRGAALLLGVVAVTSAFVLPSPSRELVVATAVVAWVAALVWGGQDSAAVVATHAAGASLLAVAAVRTARVTEHALDEQAHAAQAAGERTVLVAALLRMQALEPEVVEQAVLEGARQFGLRHPRLHRSSSPEEDPEITALVAEVRASRRPGARGRGAGQDVLVAAPLDDAEGPPAVLCAWAAAGRVAAQHDALVVLAEEAGRAVRRARRYADQAATVEELRRLETLTQDFVSTVSHELRTPVTVIAGLGQTVARRWEELSAVRRTDLLRRIDSSAERLATMVRSLLDTSALERGELVAQPVALELGELVEDVVARLASITSPRTVVIEVPAGTWVRADPGLLRHALENLLGNAANHTPAHTTVEVVARRVEAGEVEVVVADDGPGIADRDLPHVMDRFYRADPSAVARPGGLGLGLALVQQIVGLHGRQLAVHSGVGEGTRFSFRLDATDAPASAGMTS